MDAPDVVADPSLIDADFPAEETEERLIAGDAGLTHALREKLTAGQFERLAQAWEAIEGAAAANRADCQAADRRATEAEKQFQDAVRRGGKLSKAHIERHEKLIDRCNSQTQVIEILGATIHTDRESNERVIREQQGQIEGFEELLRAKGLLN